MKLNQYIFDFFKFIFSNLLIICFYTKPYDWFCIGLSHYKPKIISTNFDSI